MFSPKRIQKICFIIIVSVLLMGMCPTGMVADSFFASSRSRSVSQDATRTVLRATASTTTRTVTYTQETLPEYETILAPTSSVRRIGMRQGSKEWFSIREIPDTLSAYSGPSIPHAGCLLDEVISNTIIVNYIHHQDGAKA